MYGTFLLIGELHIFFSVILHHILHFHLYVYTFMIYSFRAYFSFQIVMNIELNYFLGGIGKAYLLSLK